MQKMKLNQNQLDKNLYQILGVDKSADDSTIKKAYRKLVVKHHPDKGGNADTFSAISEAYDILSDNRKVDYDTKSMTITNFQRANKYLTRQYRKGWEL